MKLDFALILLSLFCCLLTNSILGCKGNSSNSNKMSTADSLCFDKDLQEYHVDSCLSNLLLSIVESNEKFYSNSDFFYLLSLKKSKDLKLLTIQAHLWSNLENEDYVGVLKFNDALFLCKGDIESDELFVSDSLPKMRITMKAKKNRGEIFPVIEEPILSGKFAECNGLPIHIEVYVKGKIKGYQN